MELKPLFSAISAYTPRQGRNPREDYLTEIFAWLLCNVKELSAALFQHKHFPEKRLRNLMVKDVRTQHHLDNAGRADMVVYFQDNTAIVFEHKVSITQPSSQISSQVLGYKEALQKSEKANCYSATITPDKIKHPTDIDFALTWVDVFRVCDDLRDNVENETSKFLIDQFCEYLKEEGLSPMSRITLKQMESAIPAQDFYRKLKAIFEQLKNFSWENDCPGIEALQVEGYTPTYKTHSGRMGVEFYEKWNPGLFVGVITDPSDHQLCPLKSECCLRIPDLVIIIDIQCSSSATRQATLNLLKRIKGTHEYSKFCGEIEIENKKEFDFIQGLEKSPWRLLVLRKPLSDVIGKDKESFEDQVQAMYETYTRGINLLLPHAGRISKLLDTHQQTS